MSLTTFSIFYFQYEFDDTTRYINFKEGGGPELTAEVTLGSFTPTQMATNIENALNTAATVLAFTVTFNRDDRTFTIAATGTFSLLVATGSSGSLAFPAFGFFGANRTGAATYTGSPAGNEYKPQFILQDHISTDNWRNLVKPSLNTAANGNVEVIRFGVEKFMQANIKYITDLEFVADGKVIRKNMGAVAGAQTFMNYITQKKPFEFMPNELSRSTFQSFILDSTADFKDGTGYKLKELYDKGAPNIFETGKLVLRLIED